ncbi:MAG: universal stress protein [Parafilimonas sp.]
MKTIIAPTDFSSVSYNACLYAAKMAEDIKAELILLHVMEFAVSTAEYSVKEDVFDETAMEEKLIELKNKLCAETHNKVNIQIINTLGSAEYEIIELCKDKKPFAVIMGTHSDSFLDHFFIGSTTSYSAKHLRNPVLIIPPNTKYKAVKEIALAADLKDIYELPVNEIEMIVKLFNARLKIFYAGKDEKAINKISLGGLAVDHRLQNINPEFYFVQDKNIMQGIASLAEKHNADLLIVVSKKHGIFHKSKSRDFIFNSTVPLMVIHENDLVP